MIASPFCLFGFCLIKTKALHQTKAKPFDYNYLAVFYPRVTTRFFYMYLKSGEVSKKKATLRFRA
jgi:hypothetical protein